MARSFWQGLLGWAGGGPQPQRFGGYSAVRLVHDGRKAGLYEGRAPGDAGPCAIKVYKPIYNRTARRICKRYHLLSEGEIGLSITPPSASLPDDFPIVRTLAWGHEYDDPARCHYIVQEFVDGYNLKHLVSGGHPLLRERRLEIVRAAAQGLAFLHERGLVHRDVCTDNVLHSKAGRTKLIDLGFVAPAGIAFEEKTGTPSYMSPEQCLAKCLQPASDIYSFGVVLFEVFTGALPFTTPYSSENPRVVARRVSDLMQQHLRKPPPPPSAIAPDLPEGLERIILRCLEKAPEKRYPSIRHLLVELGPVVDVAQAPSPTTKDER